MHESRGMGYAPSTWISLTDKLSAGLAQAPGNTWSVMKKQAAAYLWLDAADENRTG